MRAPFQVLVLLYRFNKGKPEYCIFNRSKLDLWQFISGGGEDNETPTEAAIRELYEEAMVKVDKPLMKLQSMTYIPSYNFKEIVENYENIYIVPEYSFAIEINNKITLSNEHKSFLWTDYKTAYKLLKFDSNKTALYELSMILKTID